MTQTLAGKIAIVTGAAQGIGAEASRVLAARGAHVVLCDINPGGIAAVAAQIQAAGGSAETVTFDLTQEPEVAAAVRGIAELNGKIDVLFNNAAIQTEDQRRRDQDVVNMDTAAWDAAMAVNVRGPMLLCKYAIPVMIAGGGGSIVSSSSGFGLLGESTLTAYGASKAALINLTRFIATQYGKQNVRANVMAIGFVLTGNAIETTPPVVKEILLSHHLSPGPGPAAGCRQCGGVPGLRMNRALSMAR